MNRRHFLRSVGAALALGPSIAQAALEAKARPRLEAKARPRLGEGSVRILLLGPVVGPIEVS